MKVMVTGSRGFIASSVIQMLVKEGHEVIGVYDPSNKYVTFDASSGMNQRDEWFGKQEVIELQNARSKNTELIVAASIGQYRECEADISVYDQIRKIFTETKGVFDAVIHLAAKAGVSNVLTFTEEYVSSNIVGFINMAELCTSFKVGNFIFASSSSVYSEFGGGVERQKESGLSEYENTDLPISLYAATKKADEILVAPYVNSGLKAIALRFFTVYGHWGRPDMAIYKWTKAIKEGKTIHLRTTGDRDSSSSDCYYPYRDFTYISDIVESIKRLLSHPSNYHAWNKFQDPQLDMFQEFKRRYVILNVGNSNPVPINKVLSLIEKEMGKTTDVTETQIGDFEAKRTFANTQDLYKITGYKPKTSIENGIKKFVEWFSEYHK
jgi:UDP-glucuronate 4-epimerase